MWLVLATFLETRDRQPCFSPQCPPPIELALSGLELHSQTGKLTAARLASLADAARPDAGKPTNLPSRGTLKLRRDSVVYHAGSMISDVVSRQNVERRPSRITALHLN